MAIPLAIRPRRHRLSGVIKKLTLTAAILALLAFVAVLIFKRTTGPMDAAALVPPDAVAFVNLTNLPRTALRWQGTALAKIGKEPEVKAFLEKPLAKLSADPGASEASTLLQDLKPGNLFLAVTSLTSTDATALVGFQFWGNRKSFDTAVERLRKQLGEPREDLPTEVSGGVEIRVSRHSGKTIATAAVGRWGFVATDVVAIRSAIERAAGRDTSGSLATSPAFEKVEKHLLEAPDLRLYIRTAPIIDAMLTVGASMGAQPIPEQVNALRGTEAIGFTWKIDGEIQRDAVFVLATTPSPQVSLDHVIGNFTSPDTVAFIETALQPAKLVDFLSRTPLLATDPDALHLAELGAKAFGPDAGVVVDWPSGRMTPAPVALLEVRDNAAAREFLDSLVSKLPGATATDSNSLRVYTFTNGANPFLSPAAVLSGNLVLAALDPSSAVEASGQAAQSGTPAAPGFTPYEQIFRQSNELFAFVDTKSFFERAYTALRPVVIFGATVMPGLNDAIDASKLPQTTTISKYLSPIVLSQRSVEGGSLVESSGPLTAHQIAALALVGGTAGSRFMPGR